MSDALRGLVPHGVAPPDTDADDPRLGRWLGPADRLAEGTRLALVGFPSDEGVRRNGGRPGASEGPRAIREALYRMTPDPRGSACADLLSRTVDLGDVPVSGDLEADQVALGRVVGALLRRGVLAVVLGGGHETTYGHALGYAEGGLGGVHILNWDAHADVRPLRDGRGHSGSPFRQALEAGRCLSYTVAGLHPWRVAAAHADLVRQSGGRVVWADALDAATVDALADGLAHPALATFDLDAVDAAPGVSAPGVGGVGVGLWLRAAEACGRSPAVRSVDVVELSPRHDADGRTGTLAALTVWHVLRGVAGRYSRA